MFRWANWGIALIQTGTEACWTVIWCEWFQLISTCVSLPFYFVQMNAVMGCPWGQVDSKCFLSINTSGNAVPVFRSGTCSCASSAVYSGVAETLILCFRIAAWNKGQCKNKPSPSLHGYFVLLVSSWALICSETTQGWQKRALLLSASLKRGQGETSWHTCHHCPDLL